MRAIVMTSAGGPDVLVLREVPTPIPAAGELLIRAEAIGVQYAETQLRAGTFPMPTATPAVFGFEAAGTVIAAGPDADRNLIGSRVVATTNGTGAYAEQVAVDARSAIAIPDGLSTLDAVAVAAPGAVALALLETAALRGTEVVLVEAAGTGVGAYLTQLAREFGAGRVLATAGSDVKRARARTFGADDVFDHSAAGWQSGLRESLGGTTIDVVFESIGGESARDLLDALTPSAGRMLSYGMLSGRPAAVAAQDLMSRGLTLTGCGGPAWLRRVADARADILARAAARTVTPLIDSVLPLEHAGLAHDKIERRATTGKVVLTPMG